MTVITKEGLQRLDTYKYQSGGYSVLDNKMNPFWEWVEKFVPRTMAPNTVTLIGFGFMAASYFCMLFYDKTFTHNLPRWTYIFAAICQFIYQTMDAVDGKHARTTKASSPLGQLFDHGCDSFSVTFLILTVCQTVKLGPSYELLFFSGLLQLAFYCANWGEYHSGVLTTSVKYFGVTEGELVILTGIFFAGLAGPELWDTTVLDILRMAGLNLNAKGMNPFVAMFLATGLKYVVLRTMYVVVGSIVFYFFVTTLMGAKDKLFAVSQFVPVAALLGSLHFWSFTHTFHINPALILLSAALIFSLMTCKLIICSLTHMKTQLFHTEVLVFFLYALAFKFVIPHIASTNLETILLFSLPIYVIVSVFLWAHDVIEQISSYLGIHCLSLKKRERRKVD